MELHAVDSFPHIEIEWTVPIDRKSLSTLLLSMTVSGTR
jgi:hypothetical protein